MNKEMSYISFEIATKIGRERLVKNTSAWGDVVDFKIFLNQPSIRLDPFYNEKIAPSSSTLVVAYGGDSLLKACIFEPFSKRGGKGIVKSNVISPDLMLYAPVGENKFEIIIIKDGIVDKQYHINRFRKGHLKFHIQKLRDLANREKPEIKLQMVFDTNFKLNSKKIEDETIIPFL